MAASYANLIDRSESPELKPIRKNATTRRTAIASVLSWAAAMALCTSAHGAYVKVMTEQGATARELYGAEKL